MRFTHDGAPHRERQNRRGTRVGRRGDRASATRHPESRVTEVDRAGGLSHLLLGHYRRGLKIGSYLVRSRPCRKRRPSWPSSNVTSIIDPCGNGRPNSITAHRHQCQLAAPGQLPPRVEKTRRDPIATRDLRRRGTRPKRLGHQRQLLLAGPATPPFGLRQDLRHRFCGHLKRGRKGLFTSARGSQPRPSSGRQSSARQPPFDAYERGATGDHWCDQANGRSARRYASI